MLEERNVKHDVFALTLLAVIVFTGLALISYHRSDAVGPDGAGALVYPPAKSIGNICGPGGAWLADRLLRACGVGAYYLLLTLAGLDVLLLLRRRVPQPTIRAIGWLVSLCGLTTLSSMAIPAICPTLWAGPEIGPGGFLGAAGRGLLEMNFAAAGAYILTLSLILGGLLLCTDYLVLRLVAWCIGVPLLTVGKAGRAVVARRRGASQGAQEDSAEKKTDTEQADEGSEVAVRILGRRVASAAAPSNANAADKSAKAPEEDVKADSAEDDDIADEDEEEDDEVAEAGDASAGATAAAAESAQPAEGAESGAKPGMGQRLASALRIRNGARKSERDEVIEELEAASQTAELPEYQLPDINLLLPPEQMQFDEQEKEVRRRAKILEKTFANFGFNIKVVEIETGPVIAQFEVELEAGLRLAKITSLADDLAIALRVPSVRIVAPIPGKNTVGVEVPNTLRQLVRLREVMEEDSPKVRKMKVPIFLGKDVSGNPMTVDLATLPHLLIAGRTGTGKSVCLNSIIVSMIMTRRPDEVRMLMIDPKMVELSPYKNLPHLMHPVVTDMRKAEAILAWTVEKMEERYALLARAGVRHVAVYNQLGEKELMERIQPETEEERENIPLHLPYIVCIADEIADLMMTAPKEVEGHIIRLAQKSRAVGIHLVLATQKPTVDVITGLIKSNLPARICFQVASRTDSRVVLDEMGADKLLGNGDLLFLWPGTSTLLRGQGTYLSDDEITRVIGAVATTEPQFVRELVQLEPAGATAEGANRFKDRDELYEAAIDVVVREGRGSVSLLQRALGIGYGRGARLIDFMAEDGIVGMYNGSQAREVLVTPEQWITMQGEAAAEAPTAAPPRRNKIEVTPRRPSPLEDEEVGEEAGGPGTAQRSGAAVVGKSEVGSREEIGSRKSEIGIKPEPFGREPVEDEQEDTEEDDSEYGVRPPAQEVEDDLKDHEDSASYDEDEDEADDVDETDDELDGEEEDEEDESDDDSDEEYEDDEDEDDEEDEVDESEVDQDHDEDEEDDDEQEDDETDEEDEVEACEGENEPPRTESVAARNRRPSKTAQGENQSGGGSRRARSA